jgi:hypothetical protein
MLGLSLNGCFGKGVHSGTAATIIERDGRKSKDKGGRMKEN